MVFLWRRSARMLEAGLLGRENHVTDFGRLGHEYWTQDASRILEDLVVCRGLVERRSGVGSVGVTRCADLSVFVNFAHVSVVYSGRLPIVPGDRNRIPARFGDNATISGIAPPINLGALIEGLGFVDCHCCFSRCIGIAGRNSETRSLLGPHRDDGRRKISVEP